MIIIDQITVLSYMRAFHVRIVLAADCYMVSSQFSSRDKRKEYYKLM